MEFQVGTDTPYCGVPLKEIKLKKNVLLVGISNGTKTQIPNGESTYRAGDTVIVVASEESAPHQLNDIFAP